MGSPRIGVLLVALWAQDPPAAGGREAALRLLERGQIDAAVALLQDWCREQPDAAKARRAVGQDLLLHDAAAAAVPFLEQAIQGGGDDPDTVGLLGSALLLSQQAARAAELLREATRRHPERADLWFQAGMALATAQHLKEASVCLEQAVHRSPEDPVYRFWAGDLHLRLFQWREAEADLGPASRRPDAVPDAGWKLATVLARRGADAEAEQLLRQVLQQADPEARRRAAFHLGVFLFERQREEEALGHLLRVVKEVPDHRTAWGYVARCQQRLGRPEEARRAADRARELQEREDDLEARRLREELRRRLRPGQEERSGR